MRTKFNSRMLAPSSAFLSNVMIQTIFPLSLTIWVVNLQNRSQKVKLKLCKRYYQVESLKCEIFNQISAEMGDI